VLRINVWPVGDRLFGAPSKSAPGERAPLAPPKGRPCTDQALLIYYSARDVRTIRHVLSITAFCIRTCRPAWRSRSSKLWCFLGQSPFWIRTMHSVFIFLLVLFQGLYISEAFRWWRWYNTGCVCYELLQAKVLRTETFAVTLSVSHSCVWPHRCAL
jgi:hypothetical protein